MYIDFLCQIFQAAVFVPYEPGKELIVNEECDLRGVGMGPVDDSGEPDQRSLIFISPEVMDKIAGTVTAVI